MTLRYFQSFLRLYRQLGGNGRANISTHVLSATGSHGVSRTACKQPAEQLSGISLKRAHTHTHTIGHAERQGPKPVRQALLEQK